MSENKKKVSLWKRVGALMLAAAMIFSMVPSVGTAETTTDYIDTVADPGTLTRPEEIYGNADKNQGHTENAGKVTVGKSVSDTAVTVNGQTFTPEENNFIVTISQTAQVMGLAAEINVPVDVVFVLDTSGSMAAATDMTGPKANGTTGTMNRSEAMVQVINDTIEALMALNSENRVGVVVFSAHNLGVTSTAGNADNNAAIVLSPLASYSGQAATNHLTYGTGTVNWAGSVYTIHGRTAAGNVGSAERYYIGGATNIQAGIAKGAEMLMNASLSEGNTRVPFLIVLSDGAPTVSSSNDNWWEPDQQRNQGNYTYVDLGDEDDDTDDDPIEGNSFLTLLTAAYYKNKVSQHYTQYTGSENNLTVFTVGYGLETQTTNYEVQMSQMTLNPADELKSGSGNFYQADISDAWDKYVDHEAFSIQVGPPNGYSQSSTITHDGLYYFYNAETTVSYNRRQDESLTNRQPNDVKYNETWVNVGESVTYCDNIIDDIIPSDGSLTALAYNDDYYDVENASQLQTAFADMLTQISKKAISSPTKVTESHDFSGYVNFYDPIGEYMEVKDMKGVLANGNFYQGKSFSQKLYGYTNSASRYYDAEFNTMLTEVLSTRLNMTGSSVTAQELIAAALASENQAYYNSDSDYDNSIVWWGKSYTVEGEEDPQMQTLAPADNDTIEYITDSATQIPAGADYVCRSYFFYGTAGGTVDNSNHEYLYFVVRVQRSLTAPYQQTVVISAPASLLSVEKVLITEEADGTYTAEVTTAEPARVVYEVGLWDSINPYNVDQIVSSTYTSEKAADITGAQTIESNYDADTGEYIFYTNDWNRAQTTASHHRAMTHATFDAAADNSFYAFQEDTPILVLVDGEYVPYTGTNAPVGTGYYYAREVYTWTKGEGDTYEASATKSTVYIEVQLPSGSSAVKQGTDGAWYIAQGTYGSSTLVVNGDDTLKSSNNTQTSAIVAHPERTKDANNSHYTVYLGNNGKLTLKSIATKTVDITSGSATITDADGKIVLVGDILTYTIKVYNPESTAADAVVTDSVPVGTELVEGSISHNGTVDANGNITWNLTGLAAGSVTEVSFQVKVTEAALDEAVMSIDNTATIQVGNDPAYNTNTTENPPVGKMVTDSQGKPAGDVQVGDILVYSVEYVNDLATATTIIITDVIPEGTDYDPGTASHGGVYDAATKTITWTLENVQPGVSGAVTFRVMVTINAKDTVENAASIKIGDHDPRQTNKTTNVVLEGDLQLTKTVVIPAGLNPAVEEFTLNLEEIGAITGVTGVDALSGTFTVEGSSLQNSVTFENGKATLKIKHGETITIKGLPAGAIITVTETGVPGFTTTPADGGRVTIDHTTTVSVAFTNTYAVTPLSVTLNGNKALTGTAPTDTTFGFTAVPCDAAGVPTGADGVTGEATLKNGNIAISFGNLTFYAPGTYYYLVRELDSGRTGVTYDDTQYLLTIVVTDNGNGTMSAETTLASRDGDTGAFTAVTDDTMFFTNVYDPLDTSVTLEGTKTLIGRDMKNGEFSFEVRDADGGLVTTGTSNADGTISFRPITYTATGTYVYTITEINGGQTINGTTYSGASFTVTVVVTDVDGQLVASVTYPQGGVKFENSYDPGDVTAVIEADKSLVDDKGNALSLAAEAFAFVVKDASGEVVATGNNAADGSITFTPIVYTVDDLEGATSKTFTYYVSELVPTVGVDPNLYYDPAVFTVTVTLTYDETTGVLSTSISYPDDMEFNNIQNPDSVEITPQGTKTTANAPDGVNFSFTVTNTATGNVAGAGVGPANGDITFSVMSYDQTGTYTYWITENGGGTSHAGITYDGSRYLMVVTVTRNATNKLEATVVYYALAAGGDADDPADYTVPVTEPSFVNSYAAEGKIDLTGKKTLAGRALKAGEFSFVIKDAAGNEVATGTNAADGTITFSSLFFDLDDLNGADSVILTYTVSELVPESAALPGVTYDHAEHTIYIKLTDNNDGTLTVELVDAQGNALNTTDTGVAFANSYTTVEGTSARINGTKSLLGRDLDAGEFSFRLYHVTTDAQGKTVETLVDTATNAADGSFYFIRNYPAGTPAGTYTYIVREYNNNLHGVTYATAEYKVVVTVTDNGDGTLSTSVSYPDGAPVFTNTYKPDDVEVVLEGTKQLTGRTLNANDFSFVVKDADGNMVANATNAADGSITFTPIVFEIEDLENVPVVDGKQTKTFTYYISELVPDLAKDPNTYYDPTVYEVQITLTYDEATGKLTYQVNYPETVVFKNIQNPDTISVTPEGSKTILGDNLPSGLRFSFRVIGMGTDKANLTLGAVEGTGVSAGATTTDDTINFTSLVYDSDDVGKTFYYLIEEVPAAANTVTYDTAQYVMAVTIGRSATNALTKSVTYYAVTEGTNATNSANWTQITASDIEFTNEFDAYATLNIQGTKVMEGMPLEGGEFDFRLQLLNKDGTLADSIVDGVNNASGTVSFGTLIFTDSQMVDAFLASTVTNADGSVTKIYEYNVLVTEIEPETNAIPGVEYSDAMYIAVVRWEVTTGTDGHVTYAQPTVAEIYAASKSGETYSKTGANLLTGDATVKGTLEFTNIYAVREGTHVEIKGTKNLLGRDLNAGEFGFSLYHVTTDAQGNPVYTLVDTATNAADGSILFTRAYVPGLLDGYNGQRVIKYVIRENYNNLPGVTYSGEEYEVVVTLTDNGDGTMSAAVTYPDGTPVFNNTYDPDDVSVVLEGTKQLTGATLTAEAFAFVVKDEQGNIVATGNNDADGKIIFTPIVFEIEDLEGVAVVDNKQTKTFTYYITELVPDIAKDPNMYYDPAVYEVQVILTYDEATGKLTTEVKYVDGAAAFANIKNPDSVEVIPEGTKTTPNAPDDTGFSYLIVNTNGNHAGSGSSAANGDISFTVLSYSETGTYTYWIYEVNGGTTHAGITYDGSRYLMKVVVSRDQYNKLVATVTYYALAEGGDPADPADYTVAVTKVSFTNTYGAEGMINLTAVKVLEGSRELTAGEFAFKLVDKDGNGVADGIVAADGTITFSTLFFDLDDLNGADSVVLEYTMTEVIPTNASLPGVTYDTTAYKVYIRLTDNGDGTLKVEVVDAEGNSLGSDSGVTFTNKYQITTGITVEIKADKTLTGRYLNAGEFSFQLFHITTDENGNEVETLVDTATNAADGSILFIRSYSANVLEGKDQRVIRYVIREYNNALGGVVYDTDPIYVTVTVKDNDDGTMSYQVAYTDKDGNAIDAEFENVYDPGDTTYTPVAGKTLNGRNQKDDEFAFIVTDAGGNIVSTGLSKADGSVVFTPISYTAAGNYEYTISEVKGNLTGVTYTDAVYKMVVTVVDNQDGTMTATAKYYDANGTEVTQPEFVNGYTPTGTSVNLAAGKTLTGRDAVNGEFSFVVKDANGNVVATGGNYNGEVLFSGISFTIADMDGQKVKTFTYTIEELRTSQSGIVFDTTVYTAVVEVTNNYDTGALEITGITYYKDGAAVTEVVFANAYDPSNAEVVLTAYKTLVNKLLAEGEFTFQLLDDQGNVVAEAKNAADGSVVFDALTFEQAGTYTYKLVEVQSGGAADGTYTYSQAVYDVTVVVTDDGNGTLTATVTYTKNGETVNTAEFVNYYVPKTITGWELPIEATKTVDTPAGSGYELKAGQYTFQVTNTVGDVVATGTNDENGKITFNPTITLETAGWYYFRITEVVPDETVPGVTYDGTVWEVHVLVSYNEATGELYVDENDVHIYLVGQTERATHDAVEFTNVYTPASVNHTISLTKSLSGRDLASGEFEFCLVSKSSDGTLIEHKAYNDANGKVTFHLNYTEAGTYVYELHEHNNGLGGVTYDKDTYTVTVVVVDDGSGQLKIASSTITDANGNVVTNVVYTNTYNADPAIVELEALKIMTGITLTDKEFTFRLIDSNGDVVAEATNNAEGKIVFADLSFTKAGTYVYTMVEVKGDKSYITYDDAVYTVTITVTDDGKGQLHAHVTYSLDGYSVSLPTFNNTYAVTSGTSAVIEGTKQLLGRDLAAGEFTFGLYQVTDNGEVLVDTVTNSANGSFNFVLSYPAGMTPGEYTYIIREHNNGLHGVTYSTAEYLVVVTVIDSGDGTLSTSVSYPNGVPVFTNTYAPDDVTVVLEGTKELTGRELVADEFAFVVKDAAGNTVSIGSNTADGNITFSHLIYKIEDLEGETSKTFTYTVEELIPDLAKDPNMYYDPTVFTVTVTVTYDAATGKLTATVGYPAGGVVFENIQNPASVEVVPEGHKTTVSQGTLPEGLTFSFSVVDMDGNVVAGGTGAANGAISFSELSYTDVGTHYYWIYESNHAGQTAHGITYSGNRYLMEVVVTRDATNKLVAQVTYYTAGTVNDSTDYTLYLTQDNKLLDPSDSGLGVTFTNEYNASGILDLFATKTLTGRDMKDNEFLFQIKRLDTGEVLYATNVDGTVSFPSLIYTEQDAMDFPNGIRYEVSEVDNGIPGVTYSGTVYYVTVTLTDNGDGTVTATPTITDKDGNPVSAMTFENEYKVTDTEVKIEAAKNLTGRDLVAGEFSFELFHITTDANGNEVEVLVGTATNDADGNIVFTRIYSHSILDGFDGERVIKYVIREYIDNLGGVTYDTDPVYVTVTVKDNGDGTMSYDVEYDPAGATFENVYDAADTTYTPNAGKVLEGRNQKDDEFAFIVTDENGEVVSNGLSKADGTVVFTPITYTEAGTYTYTVSEVLGDLPGVTYSAELYTMVVTVVDNLDGTMTATAKYYNADGTEVTVPVFTNTYKGASVTVDVEAGKDLTGKDLKEGMFTFQLVNADDASQTYTATNGADGSIVFEDLVFTEAGTYVFTMTEVAGDDANMTYDDTVYTVIITVTDDGEGQLKASVEYVGGAVVFENVYTPDPITVTLQGTKTLTGRDLTAGEFVFHVVDAEGNPVTAGTNDADGNIIFKGIEISEECTLILTVYEVDSGDKSIVYDTTKFTVTIVVTNVDGKLIAEVTYPEGGIEFVNEYEEPDDDNHETGDETPVVLYASLMAFSALGMFVLVLLGTKKRRAI